METELKVKLEDIVLLSESITKLAPEVYGLHKKIVNEKETKTPTKEQIDLLKEKWNNLTNASIETNLYWLITEWEKIRNQQ